MHLFSTVAASAERLQRALHRQRRLRDCYDDIERGACLLLTTGAMANADEGRLGVSRVAHFPTKTATLDFHSILLCSKGCTIRLAGQLNNQDWCHLAEHGLHPLRGE